MPDKLEEGETLNSPSSQWFAYMRRHECLVIRAHLNILACRDQDRDCWKSRDDFVKNFGKLGCKIFLGEEEQPGHSGKK